MRLETIARFRDVPASQLARCRLEADGIQVSLLGVNHVSINWLASQAIGGFGFKFQPRTRSVRGSCSSRIARRNCPRFLRLTCRPHRTRPVPVVGPTVYTGRNSRIGRKRRPCWVASGFCCCLFPSCGGGIDSIALPAASPGSQNLGSSQHASGSFHIVFRHFGITKFEIGKV